MPKSATLLGFRPRFSADGDVMFKPGLNSMAVTDGHKIRVWHEGENHSLVTILGQESDGVIAPGFQKLDVVDPEGQLTINGVSQLAFNGSYVVPEGKRKPILTYVNEDADYIYLRWSSGFMPTPVEFREDGRRKPRRALITDPDFIELVRRGINPTTHGFHDLGGANSMLATEAGIEFQGPESKRLWSSVGRDRVSGSDIPHMRSDLIRMHKNGAEGVFRDIDGTIGRLVTQKGHVLVLNAQAEHLKFFELAEDRRRKAAAARREQRRLQKKKDDVPQGELFAAGESVVPAEA